MTRYGMAMDVTKCNGCYNCFLACKDEHCGMAHPPYSAAQPMTGHQWMRIVENERGQYPKVKVDYLAIPCMHCENAGCVEAADDDAIYRRADGIVLIDPAKAKGQKDLVSSCPYRVIYWNEAAQVAQKCTLCAHLLDAGWKEPRCVEACPTAALVFGDLDDPNSAVSAALASAGSEVLHPEYGLGEQVRYIGLPRNFVAGSVVFGDRDECATGVTVSMEGDGRTVTAVTDGFGDFEFEGLPANTSYKLKIAAPGYAAREFDVRTGTSVYLGDIVL
ncbi:MAG: 4Fe-4S dicluster domain-containing protein [bacterium]